MHVCTNLLISGIWGCQENSQNFVASPVNLTTGGEKIKESKILLPLWAWTSPSYSTNFFSVVSLFLLFISQWCWDLSLFLFILYTKQKKENFIWVYFEDYNLGRPSRKAVRTVLPLEVKVELYKLFETESCSSNAALLTAYIIHI